MKLPVFGISGCTCSGKTSVVQMLKSLLPKAVIFNQDDYYHPVDDERHTWCEGFSHINWELVTAFDNDRLSDDIEKQVVTESGSVAPEALQAVSRSLDNFLASEKPVLNDAQELTEDFLDVFVAIQDLEVGIAEGITIFNHERTSKLFRQKFFLTLDHETCADRRSRRSYDPQDVPGYFEEVAWPEYEAILAEVRARHGKNVQELDGARPMHEAFVEILKAILQSFN